MTKVCTRNMALSPTPRLSAEQDNGDVGGVEELDGEGALAYEFNSTAPFHVSCASLRTAHLLILHWQVDFETCTAFELVVKPTPLSKPSRSLARSSFPRSKPMKSQTGSKTAGLKIVHLSAPPPLPNSCRSPALPWK